MDQLDTCPECGDGYIELVQNPTPYSSEKFYCVNCDAKFDKDGMVLEGA